MSIRSFTLIATVVASLVLSASASANVFCLGVSDPSCTDFPADIDAAYTAANGNAVADDIRLGAGTYTSTNASGFSDGGAKEVHLIGAGPQTIVTNSANNLMQNQTFLSLGAPGSSIADLTVRLSVTASNQNTDTGLKLFNGASGNRVAIDSLAGATNVTGLSIQGSTFRNGTIVLPTTSSIGVSAQASSTVTDTSVSAQSGVATSSGPATTTLERLRISATYQGVTTDGGIIELSDSLIDLGTSSGIGIDSINNNGSVTPRTISARHVTIVGGGASSIGVRSASAIAAAKQTSTVNLSDSVIAVGGKALVRQAGNNGAQGGNSVANLTATYVNYDPASVTDSNTANGAGAITATHATNLAPGFADAAGGNYGLAPTSPLVDIGDPVAGGSTLDLNRSPRVIDGNADGIQQRDLGALELQDATPPETAIASGPDGTTKSAEATFTFTSSEPNSSFTCSLDGAAFAPCSGPDASQATGTLADGEHTFSVIATDVNGNADQTAATRSFAVDTTDDPIVPPTGDTKAPETTIAKGPKAKSRKATAKFKFSSDEKGVSFECSLDGAGFAPCASPLKLKGLKPGKHSLSVRAVDAAGNVDATPATQKFKRIKKTKRS